MVEAVTTAFTRVYECGCSFSADGAIPLGISYCSTHTRDLGEPNLAHIPRLVVHLKRFNFTFKDTPIAPPVVMDAAPASDEPVAPVEAPPVEVIESALAVEFPSDVLITRDYIEAAPLTTPPSPENGPEGA